MQARSGVGFALVALIAGGIAVYYTGGPAAPGSEGSMTRTAPRAARTGDSAIRRATEAAASASADSTGAAEPPALPVNDEASASASPPFDLGAVIERVHFAFRPSETSSALEGGHDTYDVQVEAGSFRVRTHSVTAGPTEQRTVDSDPVTFETVALGRGESAAVAVERATPPARVAEDGHVMWTRRDHAEHLRNGPDGVEQSWSFASRPDGRGDLVVRVSASGLPMVGETQHGLHFADASGLGVRYGHAVWVAADGARTQVPTEWRDHAIELRVPAHVVDQTAYPAVLDPVVGPEVAMDEPATGVAPMDQRSVRIAWNGAHYLVVWQDLRYGATADIHGARVTSAGVVVDTRGIAISSAPSDQTLPAVASNGTDFFVVWEDRRAATTRDVYGARVSAGGVVQDLSGIAISTAANEQQTLSVASDGADYYVVWEDFRATPNWDVYGARVTAAGVVQDASGVLLGAVAGNQRHPEVASNGDEYFVAWNEVRGGGNDVLGTRVATNTGVPVTPGGFDVSASSGSQQTVSVASNGTDYLVAWIDSRGTTNDAYGTRVTADGTVLDPAGLAISTATGHQQYPMVASNGTDYLVTWMDLRSNRNIYAGRVTAAGAVLDGGGIPICTLSQFQEFPAVASDGSGYLTVWHDFRGGTIPDIYGARVSAAGVLQEADGIAISLDKNAERDIVVASNGDGYLAVWEDGRSGRFEDIYGVRLTAAGDVVDPLGLAISTAPNRQTDPAIASDGDGYLVVWDDFRDANSSKIFATRVGAGGVQDPNGFRVGTSVDSGSQGAPVVASNGTHYFVVWADTRLAGWDLFGARVSSSGVVLEPDGILVSNADTEEDSPAVASDGTDFLVVWAHERSYPADPTREIFGTRVSAAGTILLPAGFVVSGATNNQLSPSVSSNGAGYFVVWEDARGGTYDIYGTRVTSAGATLDPLGIGISRVVNDQRAPAVSPSGTGYRVVWQDGRGGGVTSIFGADIDDAGAVTSVANGYVVHTGVSAAALPSIAEGAGGDTLVAYQRLDDVVARAFARLLRSDASGLPDGSACTSGVECDSGHCVDGVCCDAACGGSNTTDCQACLGELTGGADGVCGSVTFATPCGDATNSSCNASDTCDGTGTCQSNLAALGSPCGSAVSNACTAADTCTAVGTCSANDEAPGTPCVGGLFCSSGDACSMGACVEGGTSSCTASDKCDEAQDQCYPACGDGVPDPGEECDDGESNSDTTPDACRPGCRLPSCGDDVRDTGEGCDEGALNGDEPGATCRSNCALASCGDGTMDAGEECDEGNSNEDVPDAPCRTTCTLPTCGDDVQDTGEACDDGASNSDNVMDACRSTCALASCGDGVRDTGETCDDGPVGSPSCSTLCEALVLDAGVLPDMGWDAATAEDADVDAGSDIGVTVDSGPRVDAGVMPTSGGGCGCRVARTTGSGSNAALGAALLLVAVALARRSRRHLF